MAKKYLLGLDLGTHSCGWCLVDENSKIVKKQGKSLWGVRLFDEASDASSRRKFRTSRRRTQRIKERIDLLQELFAKEVASIDKNFFIRLNESMLHSNDKSYDYRYTLFNDFDFTDKDYYKKFKTIYHLRKYLLDSDKKEDIRLIYLALAHMIKYRGHFLFEKQEFRTSDYDNVLDSLNKIKSYIEYSDEQNEVVNKQPFVDINERLVDELLSVYKDLKGITKKKEKFIDLFGGRKDKYIRDILCSLLSGGTVKITKIINLDDSSFNDFKDISCNSEDFDNRIAILISNFPEYEYRISTLVEIKKIYDFLLLNKLMENEPYLSYAMVKRYDKHQKELLQLKNYFKKHFSKEKYDKFFKEYDPKNANYVSYIGSNNSNKNKIRVPHSTKDEFYKKLREELGLKGNIDISAIEDIELKEIFIAINDGNYLPRQNSSENRVLPYQLNLMEMRKILEKQKSFHPFLLEKDEYGTTIEKIISILCFKIPYYVGPLNPAHNKFSWVVREKEPINPWNFEEKVNVDETAEQFIRRMLNKCSYLSNEYCLPKDSILLNYFFVLNELNKLLVDGKSLNLEEKQELLKNVYLNEKNKKVTEKELKDHFAKRYDNKGIILTSSNSKDVSYIKGSMKTYMDFANIFGEGYVRSNIEKIEDIIKDIAIFEDKKLLDKRLKQVHNIEDANIRKRIEALPYSGFSRLSKKLLYEIHGTNPDGVLINDYTIISIMESTNLNFMEVINKEEYGFNNTIANYNSENSGELSVEQFVAEQYISPGMKRPLIQAYRIIEEIEEIIKHPIDEYYIECNRGKGEKGTKDSRKKRVLDLLNAAKDFDNYLSKEDFKKLLEQAESKNEDEFRSDKIYLYFTQLGKDMYTGVPIEIDDLNNADIDHIYPQSLIKDDSLLNNKCLVFNKTNNDKSNVYPIPYHLFERTNFNHEKFHKMLFDKGLINKEKYTRLTRKEELSEDELYNFVSRQLVYVSQSVKALKDLITTFKKDREGNTPKVVLTKAGIASGYRGKYDVLKCRETNDYHHAHDAFLNVVLGRAINRYYENVKFLKEHNFTTRVDYLFDEDGEHSKQNIMQGNNVLWQYGGVSRKYIDKVIKTRFDILMSTRTFIKNTLFEKTSITSAAKVKENALPLKLQKQGPLSKISDIQKYGGYSDLSFGSFSLVKNTDKKGDIQFILLGIPTMISNLNSEEKIIEYAIKQNIQNPEIIMTRIRINTVIEQETSRYCVTGKSKTDLLIKNIKNHNFSYELTQKIRTLGKFIKFIEEQKAKKNIDFKEKTIKEEFLDEYRSYGKLINNDNEFILSKKTKQTNIEIKISRDDLDFILKYLSSAINNPIYAKYTSLISAFDSINKEEIQTQIKEASLFWYALFVNELLKMFKCNRESSDLSFIDKNLCKNVGVLSINRKLKPGMRLIATSYTGFYEKVLWEYK